MSISGKAGQFSMTQHSLFQVITNTDIKVTLGISLVVQWLRFRLPKKMIWIQSPVRKLQSHMLRGQKTQKQKTRILYQFNEDFRNGPHQKKKKKKVLLEPTQIDSVKGLPFGEGNGTPLQYSCLENPIDGGAW